MIEVISGGLLTTVQDQGRFLSMSDGLSSCGCMDPLCARMALMLTGAGEDAALLEMTLQGAVICFHREALFALTGGEADFCLDDVPVPMNRTLSARPGQVLSIGAVSLGMRCYLSVSGGIDVPPVLGSRSTDLKSRLGGYLGRKLQAGDRLRFLPSTLPWHGMFPPPPLPAPGEVTTLRCMPGPQHALFSPEALAAFSKNIYTVSPDSDRMGIRFHGTALPGQVSGSMITEGVTMGTIQLPPSGLPILMMADHQTTGGYPKIAALISADLHLAAQLRPGDACRFLPVTADEAEQARLEQKLQPVPVSPPRRFHICINGHAYDVTAQEITC